MPHKITIQGVPVTPVKEVDNKLCSFELVENAPDGYTRTNFECNPITFTVFVTKNQIERFNNDYFLLRKLTVVGYVNLDVPMDKSNGDISVISLSVSKAPKNKSNVKEAEYEEEEDLNEISIENENRTFLTEGTHELILLEDIRIQTNWLEKLPPSYKKVRKAMKFFINNGYWELPITITKENILIDGFATYMAAREFKQKRVPIKYSVT